MKRKEIAALLAITVSAAGVFSACAETPVYVYGPPLYYENQVDDSENPIVDTEYNSEEEKKLIEASEIQASEIEDYDPSKQEDSCVYGPEENYE